MTRRRSAGAVAASIVRNVLLNVAAVAGSICIILVVLAFAFHITLIMFRTGSMSPTIPTGSVAVVRQIPATEARVGDVVTVDRPGELPITHRVVSTTPGADGTVSLRLKGDANAEPDAVTYQVTTVRRVIWHAPGLAYAIVWMSQPLVIGGLTVGIAALVTWVLWPRREEGDDS
ncbi:MAG: signal peptidase I [Microbacteriaceae bacterium]|nr:signal peptidase I [Microbacteriaceae bacterium]MCL2794745.1 signal peptidase I [Microbacteriaceae bacterium]